MMQNINESTPFYPFFVPTELENIDKKREENKIKNIVKDVISLGVRRIYWNHQLKVSLLKNNTDGVKKALMHGSTRNVSLHTWKKLSHDEVDFNQESIKLFMQFSAYKNQNRSIEKKWISQLFKDKLSPHHFNVISKVITIYSIEYSNMYQKPSLELNKFNKFFSSYFQNLDDHSKMQDVINLQQTSINTLNAIEKSSKTDVNFILKAINTSIDLLVNDDVDIQYLSKIDDFIKKITISNLNENIDQINFGINDLGKALAQAKESLFLRGIKDKDIELIQALVNNNFQGSFYPLPISQKLLISTLEFPEAFNIILSKINDLDTLTFKTILFFLKNSDPINLSGKPRKNLYINKILEFTPKGYSFDNAEQEMLIQYILSKKSTIKYNDEIFSKIDLKKFSSKNQLTLLLGVASSKTPFSLSIMKDLIPQLSKAKSNVLLYSALLYQNDELTKLFQNNKMINLRLNSDDLLSIFNPSLPVNDLKQKKSHLKNEWINYLEKLKAEYEKQLAGMQAESNVLQIKTINLKKEIEKAKNSSPQEILEQINSIDKIKAFHLSLQEENTTGDSM